MKTTERSDLAILGGSPSFDDPMHVGRPNVMSRDRFHELVEGMLDRAWLTNNGPLVDEFEKRIAAFVGVKHCIAVCNATVALELSIRAAGLRGEVIVPSYTFIATAHSLQWQEITPVFADIDQETHNLDPSSIERHITPRTTGIVATHLWGRPCAIEALEEIAHRRNLTLLFDAAHAFGCSHNGRMIGGFGMAEVFSFHATKFLNSFEGGAITTNDDELAARLRLMKNFGFKGYDNVVYVGTNGKLTEVCAAMGLSNFESLERLVAINRRNYTEYCAELADIPGIKLLQYDEAQHCNYQYIVVEVDETVFGLSRDDMVQVLHAEHVLARKYFWPGCHRMEPYRSHNPDAGLLLENTESLAARVIVLPTGTSVDIADVSMICGIFRSAPYHADAVKQALRAPTPALSLNGASLRESSRVSRPI